MAALKNNSGSIGKRCCLGGIGESIQKRRIVEMKLEAGPAQKKDGDG